MRKIGIVELEAAMAVARRRSFRAASSDLGVSPTALSQTIAGLEARLGVRLFNRTTRSLSPTNAGEQFLAEVEPAVGAINHAVETVNSHRDRPAGSLRINSSVGAARRKKKRKCSGARSAPSSPSHSSTEKARLRSRRTAPTWPSPKPGSARRSIQLLAVSWGLRRIRRAGADWRPE